MSVLYALERIRNPILNVIMQLITYLGQENLFIIAAIGVFWCVNKRRGYYMLTVGFVGTALNQILKLIFRIPRPWVLDPDFTVVESAKPDAVGYSFPSGHTQAAAIVFGTTARWTDRRWVRYICIAVMLLVAFSRMYMGVHTPLDVSVSLAIGVVIVFAIYPYFANPDRSVFPMVLVMLAAAVAFALAMALYPFGADFDAAYIVNTTENAFKMLGCVAGIAIACPVEERYVKFDTAAPPVVQAVKLAVGFAVIAALRAGLKAPLNLLMPEAAAGAVRYFAIVLFAGLAWPTCFKELCRVYGNIIAAKR